jgi:hypothetical protein
MKFLAFAAIPVALIGSQSSSKAVLPVCRDGPDVIINAEALENALKCAANGSNLKLASANFGSIEIRNLSANDLVMESADPLRPARFTALAIYGSNGFTLRHIRIAGDPPQTKTQGLSVFGATRFKADHIDVIREPSSRPFRTAVLVRETDNIALRRFRIKGHIHGIGLLDVKDAELIENSIWQMQTDGIRGGGVNNIRIARNVIGSFSPKSGDHPDGVQFWSQNQKEPSQGILIEDNLILRGTGGRIQGIFLRDTQNLPFKDVTVRRNLLVGTAYNGIAVAGYANLQVTDNIIVPMLPETSWIRAEAGTNLTVTGNRAGRFLLPGGTSMKRNRVVKIKTSADDVISSWRLRLRLPEAEFPI